MMRWLLKIFGISVVIWECQALYFFLKKGEETCFIQELSDEMLLVAKYRCSIVRKKIDRGAEECGLMINITDPNNDVVMSRLYRHEGLFSYKSQDEGVHTVCMHSNSPSYKEKTKVDFDLQVGEQALNESLHKRRIQVVHLEKRYLKLLENAKDIKKEMDYLRYREKLFRNTTETVGWRIVLWMIAEIVLLVVVGVWQVEHLRRYFDLKKLV